MKICIKCNRDFEDEFSFCDQCGSPLQAKIGENALKQEPNDTENISAQKTAPAAAAANFSYTAIASMIGNGSQSQTGSVAPEITGSVFPGSSPVSSWDLSRRSREIAESMFANEKINTSSGNPYIRVEYRENIFFLAGMQVPFELRLTVLDPAVKKIAGWFSPQLLGQENVIYDIAVETDHSVGNTMDLFIPYLPSDVVSGMIPFHFYFACLLDDGESKFYHMVHRHQVYPRNVSSESVINNISISASQAGSISSNIRDLLTARQSRSAEDLLDSLNKMPSLFKIEQLEETLWRPENSIAAGRPYRCEKLTIMIDDHYYQIVGKKVVKFGRKVELNDIVVADMVQAKDLHSYPNSTVSRNHAQIHYCGDSVNIFDNSSYGTYINNCRPTDCGIPIPNETVVEFGDIHWNIEMQRCEICPEAPLCKVCPANKIKSVCFTRRDNVPESYLLVWECCEMGYLHTKFSGFTIIRRNDGFILKTPEGKYYHMYPGMKTTYKDVNISVLNFKQFGI